MQKRWTRIETTGENRRRVIDAARAQFVDKGYHGTSLDAIAQAAGFSKGVVYSQFGSKDDLFLALLEERLEQRQQHARKLSASLSGPEGVRLMAREAIGVSAESAAWQALLLEFRAHAARHAALNERYMALHRRTIAYVAEIIAAVFERGGTAPPMPPASLATALLALGTGLSAELLADPRLDVRRLAGRVAEALVAHEIPARTARQPRRAA